MTSSDLPDRLLALVNALINIVVRAKRDADAVRAMLAKFYGSWRVSVSTLKGARGPRALEALEEAIRYDAYNIVLLGREDASLVEHESEFFPRAVLHVVPRSKVRNARILNLAKEFERARARYRTVVRWLDSGYLMGPGRGLRLVEDSNPAHDNFLVLGEEGHRALEVHLGPLGETPLLVRKFGGEHDVYSGPRKIGVLKIPDVGKVEGNRLEPVKPVDVRVEDVVRLNEDILRFHEKVSLNLLRGLKDDFDAFIVPWSGGKDSTVALVLALKALGARRLCAVYVDTGLDFPESAEYVKSVAKSLGVRLEVARAPVDAELRARGLPTHDNRWCTKLKIAALYAKVRELAPEGRVVVVVGDRDAESELRSRRPPVRGHEGITQVAPLKMWSASLVQLYLLREGIPFNPLYDMGFYRIGCYICPALRSWEVELIERARAAGRWAGLPHLDEFLELRKRYKEGGPQ
ncbi:MAG: phosphoadenosine phosphosulfate reductase [Thermoprotei archaeon]|nr:MAG: phosphoadenosine phosphosulfate reductase [Thermoprotei archaeon]